MPGFLAAQVDLEEGRQGKHRGEQGQVQTGQVSGRSWLQGRGEGEG